MEQNKVSTKNDKEESGGEGIDEPPTLRTDLSEIGTDTEELSNDGDSFFREEPSSLSVVPLGEKVEEWKKEFETLWVLSIRLKQSLRRSMSNRSKSFRDVSLPPSVLRT